MSDKLPDREPTSFLVIHIDNRRAIPLNLLVNVFDALDRDFRQMTGHELTVWEVRRGSLTVLLAQLGGLLESANQLFGFGKRIADIADAAIRGVHALRDKRQKGAKTILALAKIAEEADGEVQLSYRKSPGREEVVMVMTATQGANLQKRGPKIRKEPTLQIPPPEPKHDTTGDLGDALAKAIDAQHDMPLSVNAPELVPPLVQELVEALRERPGGQEVLADMARRLRDQGRNSAARILES